MGRLGRYCNAQNTALATCVLSSLMLVAAIALPWFFTFSIISDPTQMEPGATKVTRYYLWHWEGAWEVETIRVNGTKATEYHRTRWNDPEVNLRDAKGIYIASNTFAVVALALTLINMALLILLTCAVTRQFVTRAFDVLRIILVCNSAVTLVAIALAWGLFINFPSALGGNCVPRFSCSLFFGNKSMHGLDVGWGPFIGWICALMVTPFPVIYGAGTFCISKPRYVENEEENPFLPAFDSETIDA